MCHVISGRSNRLPSESSSEIDTELEAGATGGKGAEEKPKHLLDSLEAMFSIGTSGIYAAHSIAYAFSATSSEAAPSSASASSPSFLGTVFDTSNSIA